MGAVVGRKYVSVNLETFRLLNGESELAHSLLYALAHYAPNYDVSTAESRRIAARNMSYLKVRLRQTIHVVKHLRGLKKHNYIV